MSALTPSPFPSFRQANDNDDTADLLPYFLPGTTDFAERLEALLAEYPNAHALPDVRPFLGAYHTVKTCLDDAERGASKLDLEPPRLIQARLAHSQAVCEFTIALHADQDAERELQDLIDEEPTGIRRYLGRYLGKGERYAQRMRKAEALAAKTREALEIAELNRAIAQERSSTEESAHIKSNGESVRQHQRLTRAYRAELQVAALACLSIIGDDGLKGNPTRLLQKCRQQIEERSRGIRADLKLVEPAPSPEAPAPRPKM